MKLSVTIMILGLLVVSTLTAQTKKEEKAKIKLQQYQEIKTIVESKQYEFQADWAIPLQGTRVNLTTNDNFLRIRNDSADIFLPFFGTLLSGSAAMDSKGGIFFKGLIENYKIKVDDHKQKLMINFTTRARYDIFDFQLIVSHGGNTQVNVNSNYRSNIKYNGSLKKSEIKE